MSMIDRSLDGMAFLSGQLGTILRRRLRELGGVALLSLAMMAALALATWSVDDPSLSHATDSRVHNLLGRTGAIAADLLMQLLGLGSLALLLPIAIWGYRLLGHRPLRHERVRVLLWLLGAVLAAAFASCLPRGAHWPLPCGLGGVIGDALLRLPIKLFGAPLLGTYRLAATVVLGAAALVTFAGAAGLLWGGAADDDDEAEDEDVEEEDEDEIIEAEDEEHAVAGGGWLSLGGLMHAVLSFRARLARIFCGRPPVPAAPRGGAAVRRRVEPRFDGRPDLRTEEEADDELTGSPAPRTARKPPATPKPARRSSGGYKLPPLDLLAQASKLGRATVSSEMLKEN